MISVLSFFPCVLIVLVAITLVLSLKHYRSMGGKLSIRALVLRSFTFALLTLLPTIVFIWYFCLKFEIDYSSNPVVTVVDHYVALTSILAVLAQVYMILFMSRDCDRMNDRVSDNSSVSPFDREP